MDSFQLCLLRHHIKISTFPNLTLLAEASLQRGEWQSCTTKMIDGTNLQAVRFVDLQTKDFLLTCSTAIPDLPRKTKHQGLVQHPQVADST